MMSAWAAAALVVTVLSAPPSAHQPAPQAPRAALPDGARVGSEISHLLELHHALLNQAQPGAGQLAYPLGGEFEASLAVYRKVIQAKAGRAVWQTLNDACVEGPDINAIRALAANLPASMASRDKETVLELLQALAGAWPRYEKTERPNRQQAIAAVRIVELQRRYGAAGEPSLMPVLLHKMMLRPLDAPITVYPVLSTPQNGAWGKTAKGYYVILATTGRPIIESLVHEVTHLLETNQPAGARTFQKRLQEEGAKIEATAREEFLHGLVIWNAVELIRRFVATQYNPAFPPSMQRWLDLYRSVWGPYLDGKADASATIARFTDGIKQVLAASGAAVSPAP